MALLAVASGGGSLVAPSRGEGADRVGLLIVVAALLGLGLPVGAVVALALRRIPLPSFGPRSRGRGSASDDGESPPVRVTLLRALPVTIFVVVMASLLVISRGDLRRAVDEGPRRIDEFPGRTAKPLSIVGWWENTRVKAGEGEPEREPGGTPDPESNRRRALLLALAALGAAVAGTVVWRATRSDPDATDDPAEGEAAREAAHGAVVGTIDAMLSDPDPRTAVIGAYARLLEGLSACGTARRDFEAPKEHLRRVLAVLDVRSGPSRRLVELFEKARFSSHRLTSAHREAALDALRAVAADLAVSPDAPPPGARLGAGEGVDPRVGVAR